MKRRHFLATGTATTLSGWLAACGGSSSSEDPVAVQPEAVADDGGTRLAAARAPLVPSAAVNARVTIVGGGMAGATLAKYLRLWSGGTIGVTLVEREPRYTSNIMSSLVLTGQRTLDSLRYAYTALRDLYGVGVVQAEVVGVDASDASVRLADGRVLAADRLVLAPGIDFDPMPGLANPDLMPHAWRAGPQTTLLAQRLAALPPAGTVVLTIPKMPYRCPPGPYERACLVADWLKRRKPGARLIVLDANPDFVTERDNFSRAFTTLHGAVIDYRPGVDVLAADGPSGVLTTSHGPVRGDVVNLIPRQRAAPLIAAAGLANSADGRFAAVDVLSYGSTIAPRVHVLGDASATTQPKAGHIANQEAKVCADALVRLLAGGTPDPAPVTNSACYSTITMSQASWLTAVFQYDPSARAMAVVPASSSASSGWSSDHFEEMNTWFRALMADTFA